MITDDDREKVRRAFIRLGAHHDQGEAMMVDNFQLMLLCQQQVTDLLLTAHKAGAESVTIPLTELAPIIAAGSSYIHWLIVEGKVPGFKEFLEGKTG